jgi:hypothetical protein
LKLRSKYRFEFLGAEHLRILVQLRQSALPVID